MTEGPKAPATPKWSGWIWAAAAALAAGVIVAGLLFGQASKPVGPAGDGSLTEVQLDRLAAKIQAEGIPGYQFTTAETSTAGLDPTQLEARCRPLGELMQAGYLKAVNLSDSLAEASVGIELWRPGTDFAAVVTASTECAGSTTTVLRDYDLDGAHITWLAWNQPADQSLILTVGNVMMLARIPATDEAAQDEIVAALLADYQAVRG